MMPSPQSSRRSGGFSLVELMVGVLVAMVAIVVVMQIFKVSEGQRRATTGGDDAQTTGSIALTQLQRDLRQAGQGLSNASLLDCSLTLPNGRNIARLAPVTINPTGVAAADANTDVLLIAYGSGIGSPEGSLINSQPGAAIYSVAAPQAFPSGDFVAAAPQSRAAPCALTLTTVIAPPAGNSVTVAAGVAGVANGTLFDFGRTPRFVVYAIRSGRLTMCDLLQQDCSNSDAANWSEVADGVVSMRAEYGRDTSVTRDAVPDLYDQTTPATWCAWSRVVAVHAALVLRSRQPEKENVAASAPTWSRGSSSPDITLNGSDWQRYRYRTYETLVPLRNMPTAADPNFASC